MQKPFSLLLDQHFHSDPRSAAIDASRERNTTAPIKCTSSRYMYSTANYDCKKRILFALRAYQSELVYLGRSQLHITCKCKLPAMLPGYICSESEAE